LVVCFRLSVKKIVPSNESSLGGNIDVVYGFFRMFLSAIYVKNEPSLGGNIDVVYGFFSHDSLSNICQLAACHYLRRN
jgi:hypothetical protein